MASIVSAGTTSATALNMSADTSGVLQLASNNGTVGVTLSTAQNLLVGSTTDNGYKLKVVGGNASNLLIDNGGQQYTQLLLQRNGTANTGGDILIDGTSGSMNIRGLLAGPMVFYTSASAGSPAEGMRISSAGYVTQSLQPMFFIAGSNGTNITLAANTPLTQWTVVTNIGGNWNNSTNRFTAPITGRYLFSVAIDVRQVGGTTGGAIGGISVNGGYVGGADAAIGTSTVSISGQPSGLTQTMILQLTANDYVEFVNRNTQITYYNGHSFASGYLLG